MRMQWMQLGDPTRVHCKNHFQNIIAKVNSSPFLVLDNYVKGQRTSCTCLYSAPRCATYISCFHMDCKPEINYVFDKWMTIPSIVFIPGHRLLESVRDNISTTRSQVVEIHTNNKWYLCHRHERVNHSKEFKNGEHSMMKTWICLFCRYCIMNDSDTNILYVKL